MTILRILLGLIRDVTRHMLGRDVPDVDRSERAVRVCRVEEAANVRAYYGCDRADLTLWEAEMGRSDA